MLDQVYSVNGMHCQMCVKKVEETLRKLYSPQDIFVDLKNKRVTLRGDKKVNFEEVNAELEEYSLSEYTPVPLSIKIIEFCKTYYPVILIFIGITIFSFANEFIQGNGSLIRWMHTFMGLFFISFSFFKFINLKGFVSAFREYDLIAAKSKIYAYLYPFLELGLGLAMIFIFQPLWTNVFALVLTTIGAIGVVKALNSEKEIKCACLGGLFNLPMSKVAFFENFLMIVMSILMILFILFPGILESSNVPVVKNSTHLHSR